MALGYDIALDRSIPSVIRTLETGSVVVKEKVLAEVVAVGNEIATGAATRVKRHPSGLWKHVRGSGVYRVKTDGLSVKVETPGGAIGKAEAISEFALADPSGKHLGRTLSGIYGRDKGRILWATYDEHEAAYVAAVEAAVTRGAAEVERSLL